MLIGIGLASGGEVCLSGVGAHSLGLWQDFPLTPGEAMGVAEELTGTGEEVTGTSTPITGTVGDPTGVEDTGGGLYDAFTVRWDFASM